MSMRLRHVFILCCLSILFGCNNKSGQQAAGGDYPMMTLKAEDRTLSLKYSAVTEGRQDVEVRPQISGKITQVCVKEGAYVRKGQVLFVIDQVPYRAAVAKHARPCTQKPMRQLQSRHLPASSRCMPTR